MNTCERCGRVLVDAMTLNSTGIDKTLCYREETGSDKYCDKINRILFPPKKVPKTRTFKQLPNTMEDSIRARALLRDSSRPIVIL